MVEQLFRKQQVGSSILPVGSSACGVGRRDSSDCLNMHKSGFVDYGLPMLFGDKDRVDTDTRFTASDDQGIVMPSPRAQRWNWSS